MHSYLNLLRRVISDGERVKARNGMTRRLLGQSLALHGIEDAFPLLTTRLVFYRPVLGELAAFMRGATLLSTFHRFGCHYWDANAAAWGDFGSVGRIYGAQWRSWNDRHKAGIDQLDDALEKYRAAPESRSNLVIAWNPEELRDMCLPPCHFAFQLHNQEGVMAMTVYMRSVDVCLGLPSDMVLYAALLMMLARDAGTKAGSLYFQFGDCHVYENHVKKAADQQERTPIPLPKAKFTNAYTACAQFEPHQLLILNYSYEKAIHYELNV